LFEETELKERHYNFVAEHLDWLAYELPEEMRTAKHGRGQVQKWFLFEFSGNEEDIILKPKDPNEEQEFRAFKWITLNQLAK